MLVSLVLHIRESLQNTCNLLCFFEWVYFLMVPLTSIADYAMANLKNKSSQKTENFEGRYTNCFQIGQNEFEVLIDCGQSHSENGKEYFHTRIVCNPFYANVLFELLQKSIKRHGNTFSHNDKDL